jgi:hypothetical protein
LQLYDFPKSYIDRAGKTVIKLPEEVGDAGPFSEGVARIQVKGYSNVGMVGYIDRTGKMIVPPKFARAGDFHSGLARVVLDGQCFIVEENGSHEAPPSVPPLTDCGGISDEIKVRCHEGYIDKSGNLRFEFQGTRDFSENLAAVSVNGKWGYINSQGTMIIEPQFDEALKFSEGLAAVRQKSLWGYINHDGVTVIPLKFAEGNSFSNGVGRVNGGYIDKTGRFMPSTFADESDFVQGLAHVTLGSDQYGYIDKSGKILFRYRAKSGTK